MILINFLNSRYLIKRKITKENEQFKIIHLMEGYLIGDILPARQYFLKQPQKESRQVFTESCAKPLGLIGPHFSRLS